LKAAKRVLAKSDFSVSIDPKRGVKDPEKEFAKYSQGQTQQFAELAQLEKTSELDLFKRPSQEPDPEKSVFVSLQRVRGKARFGFGHSHTFCRQVEHLPISATRSYSFGNSHPVDWRSQHIH
jgi:hypothetical protein